LNHAVTPVPDLAAPLPERVPIPHMLRDFTATRRMLVIAAIAAGIGAAGAVLAWTLLKMIAFFTNLFYFQTFSFAETSPATNTLGWRCSCRS
jgi:hypothetical protein